MASRRWVGSAVGLYRLLLEHYPHTPVHAVDIAPGMIDTLRHLADAVAEARDAVAACRRAGVAVKMVTGDHPVTALAIARDLGLM